MCDFLNSCDAYDNGCDEVNNRSIPGCFESDSLKGKKDPVAKLQCSDGLGREPLRIECGQGKVGVYDGDLEGVPCLTLGNDGSGTIGEPTGREMPSAIPAEVELVTVTFTNTDSVDVFIRALKRMRARIKAA